MAGYIGSKASVVTPGAERKKVFSITTTTTSLTGLVYTPGFVHVYHNGVRLVDGTDYTATSGTSITLTTAAQNGDEVVVISFATFQTSDTVSASAGGTFSNDVAINGDLTVDTDTFYVDSTNNRVGVGTTSPSANLHIQTSGSGDALIVESTDSGDTFAPDIAIYRNTSTPADNDGIGLVSFRGRNDAAEDVEYVQIVTGTGDVSDGTESGNFGVKTIVNGTLDSRLIIDNSGNVGIGTSSPAGPLEVESSSNRLLTLDCDSTADFTMLSLRRQGTEAWRYILEDNGDFSIREDANLSGEVMRLDTSGGLRVGLTTNIFNTASSEKITVKNTSIGCAANFEATNVTGGYPILYLRSTDATASQIAVYFYRTNTPVGSISTTASSTAYNTSSDYRLKENVVDLGGAADRLAQIPVHRFNFIVEPDRTVDGFLAHEVQAIVPEAVTGEKDAMRLEQYEVEPAVYDDEGNIVTEAVMGEREVPDYQGIDQSKLVPLLTAALQEALQKIDALEARVAALEAV